MRGLATRPARTAAALAVFAAGVLWALCAAPAGASSGDIATVAGDGTAGYGGDTGPATAAQLDHPSGVAVDAGGAVFVADYANNRVRRVGTDGIITTVAGTGTAGFSGDGGVATAAELNGPIDVAVDRDGNLYVADAWNNRVRRISPGGTITTFAGNGSGTFTGDGGPATSAALNFPSGIAVDPVGFVYVADSWNSRVRRVELSSGTITTVAGGGLAGLGDGGPATAAQLDSPTDVAVAPDGSFVIADAWTNRIRRVDLGGAITTVAGSGVEGAGGDGGPATSAQLFSPNGVVVDPSGQLFIADTDNGRVRKVDTTGTISTVAGTGVFGYNADGIPATSAHLWAPIGLAVDASGNLLVGDNGNSRVRMVETAAPVSALAPLPVAVWSALLVAAVGAGVIRRRGRLLWVSAVR